ncbi:hypothetical protein [Streptomyces sp. NPDC096324]|uniref:hypothetical protein n=1 Tax=Streptomyces sp. NPDC096324 TaxID=3366085 RepID=UPI0037F9D006
MADAPVLAGEIAVRLHAARRTPGPSIDIAGSTGRPGCSARRCAAARARPCEPRQVRGATGAGAEIETLMDGSSGAGIDDRRATAGFDRVTGTSLHDEVALRS